MKIHTMQFILGSRINFSQTRESNCFLIIYSRILYSGFGTWCRHFSLALYRIYMHQVHLLFRLGKPIDSYASRESYVQQSRMLCLLLFNSTSRILRFTRHGFVTFVVNFSPLHICSFIENLQLYMYMYMYIIYICLGMDLSNE